MKIRLPVVSLHFPRTYGSQEFSHKGFSVVVGIVIDEAKALVVVVVDVVEDNVTSVVAKEIVIEAKVVSNTSFAVEMTVVAKEKVVVII